MLPATATNHVVATSLLCHAHLTVRTRLSRLSDLIHIFLGGFALVAHLVELMTCHAFVPSTLVVEAYLSLAFGAADKGFLA